MGGEAFELFGWCYFRPFISSNTCYLRLLIVALDKFSTKIKSQSLSTLNVYYNTIAVDFNLLKDK